MTKKALVRVEEVSRCFALDHTPGNHTSSAFVYALNTVNLTIRTGDFLAISGPSGSGKSTLLNLIGCIDKPTSGNIFLDDINITTLKPHAQSLLRRNKIGFVFQTFNLIPVFTAAENVEYPLLIQGVGVGERKRRVAEALESVDLTKRAQHRPDLLSGGERQRVAVARAIVHRPALVLADEPTANLDTQNATQLIALMRDLNQSMNLTFVFSTHDARLLGQTSNVVQLCDGRIQVRKSFHEVDVNSSRPVQSNVERHSMEGVHHV